MRDSYIFNSCSNYCMNAFLSSTTAQNKRLLYAIYCYVGNEPVYLDVDGYKCVVAQKLEGNACPNYFTLDFTGPNEFIIQNYESITTPIRIGPHHKHDVPSTPCCLEIDTKLGINEGPLYMTDSVKNIQHCRLELCSRLKSPVNMSDFLSGKEMFYIRTSRPRFQKTGYLYLKPTTDGTSYILACKQSTEEGKMDDRMLFKAVRYEDTYLAQTVR